MKPSTPTIHVSRAILKAGLNLQETTDLINKAVWEQYAVFGAQSEYDIMTEEIHMDFVVVHDYTKLRYIKANYKVDKSNIVKFSNVEYVKRQWAVVKNVERNDDNQMTPIYWTPPTTWGNILVRKYV